MEQRYEFRNRLNQTQKKLDFTKNELLSNEITLENGVAFVGFTSCVVENAKNCIEIAQRDSVIGYEPSMGYAGDKPYIEWKIKQTQYMLDVEIPMYRESLRY